MIVGKIGCGKSSVLKAICNVLFVKEGKVNVNGSISYLSQQPFLVNGSIKENILLGQKYDEQKFNKIIRISQLEPDLLMFPGRENTEIGQ